jgi:hypothetical protein
MTNQRWLPLGISAAALVLMGALAYGGPEETKRTSRSKSDPAAEAFMKLMPVLVHPRCSNCHGPMTFHDVAPDKIFPTDGGPAYLDPGSTATHPGGEIGDAPCEDCHTEAKDWSIGPEWPIQSAYQLCLQLKGSRPSGEIFLSHLTEDHLIGLAFVGKKGQDDLPAEPPPMSREAFIDAAKKWIDAMDAMDKYPPDPKGCGTEEVWVGSIQYSYSEVGHRYTVTAQGKGQFPLVKRGAWSGQATRVEDHNATGCPSVLTGNASGNGNITLTVIDPAAGVFTGSSNPGMSALLNALSNPAALAKILTGSNPVSESPTLASLTLSPPGYSVRLELPMKGKAAYAGGGPACPGYKGPVSDFPYTIRAEADGQIDPDNPDVLAGSKTTTPHPGATMTTTWNFKRTRQ